MFIRTGPGHTVAPMMSCCCVSCVSRPMRLASAIRSRPADGAEEGGSFACPCLTPLHCVSASKHHAVRFDLRFRRPAEAGIHS